MKIDEKLIKRLEVLARMELTPDERETLAEQLTRIVEYVEQLQDIDTENVEPTTAVVHQEKAPLRPDEPRPGLERDVVLSEAPDRDDGYFRVPKIIER